MTTGNCTVDAMSGINIEGNIIPPLWYKTILRENGKPNLVAITILSDIVYWYRPTIERDETTGQVVGIKKKFKADKLQRSYQQLADQFGISKREATAAIVELEKIGVVDRDLRTINAGGILMGNVLFIGLNPEKLYELTHPDIAITLKRDRGSVETLEGSLYNGIGYTPKRETNTEITTKNTTETTTDIYKQDAQNGQTGARNENQKRTRKQAAFVPPTLEEIAEYCQERQNGVDPKKFFDYFTASNWYDSKGNKVKSWKQKIITWEGNSYGSGVASVNTYQNHPHKPKATGFAAVLEQLQEEDRTSFVDAEYRVMEG